MSEGPRNLRTDTELTPDPEVAGRFHADIPDNWKVVYVFGGVSMYTALRAMREALGRPELELVTANAIFLAPVPPGPVTIDVEVLRDGRTASQVAADLRVDGKIALRAHGVFGVAHDIEHGFLDVQFPDVPGPLELELPEPPEGFNRGPFEHINFHEQTDWRPIDGFAPWDPDFKAGPARMKVWTRLICEPQLPDGSYDPLALAIHGDVIGPAVGQGLGPIGVPFMVLSLEIGIRFVAAPVTPWVLQEIEAWHVGDGYATGPARLWDEEGNLCAIATQTANMRLFPGTTPNRREARSVAFVTTSEASGSSYLPPMLNPFEPGFFDNPYAQYAQVREQDPVHLSPLGIWAVFRYEDVHRLLRDPRLSVEERNATQLEFTVDDDIRAQFEARREGGSHTMLNLDPPDHHRLRRLVAKVFTPRTVEALHPRVQELVDESLDAVTARGTGEMDLIADLAFPLPFVVISEMLGIPEGRDRHQLREWSGAIVKTFDPILTREEQLAAFDAIDNIRIYIDETIAWKRANPADDLLSALISAEDEGDRLSPEELMEQVLLLYVAGHETTVNLVGNGTLALLRHREQLEALQRDPALDANLPDELLRYDSPVQMSRRITLEPLELGGKTINAGCLIMTCLGSANRDPLRWGDTADQLDLRRADANQHMAFGGGVHSCLGAHLARLEARVAIGTLVRRFPKIDLATDQLEWNGRIVLRGLNALPLTIN